MNHVAAVLDSGTQSEFLHPRWGWGAGLLCRGDLGMGGREEPIVDHGGKVALELTPAYSREAACLAGLCLGGSRDDINRARQTQHDSCLIGSETLIKCLFKGLLESGPAFLS